MKTKNTQYGIVDIAPGAVLCRMEKGGDKDGKAIYRFSDTGERTTKRHIALVTNETLMNDLYGAPWAHTAKGWIKAEDKITWYSSYKEASNAYASLTNRKRKIVLTVLIMLLITLISILIYKIYKNKCNQPPIQTPLNTDINEIPMD